MALGGLNAHVSKVSVEMDLTHLRSGFKRGSRQEAIEVDLADGGSRRGSG
ncbi:unnamed protein product [Prorocentrum cordatum]|uniref:Uncharacterized protein n=1 Tax=Prorocentrum cordatum TaxID=2364126 RepID=A0ABN9SLR6_9DINO|nr:unnamed protein product [Polarella glacialis]